jgi:hypothetical protein
MPRKNATCRVSDLVCFVDGVFMARAPSQKAEVERQRNPKWNPGIGRAANSLGTGFFLSVSARKGFDGGG